MRPGSVTGGGIWSCKIGEVTSTPGGADFPMREAVRAAYLAVTGEEPTFIFSGWGAELTESERAVVVAGDGSVPNLSSGSAGERANPHG
jgi:hypothetical protein